MIGEIVTTSSLDFIAESLTLHQPPALGSLVKVNVGGAAFCYGVVCFGTTSSADSGRRAIRRSTAAAQDEQVYQTHPQLERLLQTTFRVLLVGWQDGQRWRHSLPPSPPPLHHAVHPCDDREAQTFTNQRDYFRLILQAACELPNEQVLGAHIRHIYALRQQDTAWLTTAARECAQLLKQDHQRLLALLSVIDPN